MRLWLPSVIWNYLNIVFGRYKIRILLYSFFLFFFFFLIHVWIIIYIFLLPWYIWIYIIKVNLIIIFYNLYLLFLKFAWIIILVYGWDKGNCKYCKSRYIWIEKPKLNIIYLTLLLYNIMEYKGFIWY